jgi:glycogen debranching enzyme
VVEISRIKDRYYISATSSAVDPKRLVLKCDDTFGVFDRFGDVLPLGRGEQGLYHQDTRFLSRLSLSLEGQRPLFLSSNVDEDNVLASVDLTNPDIYRRGRLVLAKDSVHILRQRLLRPGLCLEELRLRNFSRERVALSLSLNFEADFADIFEVRGLKRRHRGRRLGPVPWQGGLRFRYQGLDGLLRETVIRFKPSPELIKGGTARWPLVLEPGQTFTLELSVQCLLQGQRARRPLSFGRALAVARRQAQTLRAGCAELYTANEQFNESLKRSMADVRMMLSRTPWGLYPYAGIPWFCTAFGRDAIITALQCLWVMPWVARGVLGYLAHTQAQGLDKATASEPGKILHEARKGEMAALGEVPFRRYYGSVDATPLFVILAGAYYRRTGHLGLLRRLWRHLELALSWMSTYGDPDRDGFLEYTPGRWGLLNQGWKDSADSMFYEDGSFPQGPLALCEVQGYAFRAKLEAAYMARALGKEALAEALQEGARKLKQRFDQSFWDEHLGAYVLALDARKRPLRVLSSNAAQSLFTGIVPPERARRLAQKVLSPQGLFSGWGVRTLSPQAARYNPMSYHNGSVWPHDNALIAWGLASYGLKEEFVKLFGALFDASLHMELQRLPELFCGFHRRQGQPPTQYPVACSPQAWASGALLLVLQAALGLEFEPTPPRVLFRNPTLPPFLQWVRVRNLLTPGGGSMDFTLVRYEQDVALQVLSKPPGVEVVVLK